MGYIITATFDDDHAKLLTLLENREIRTLKHDTENEMVTVDMRGDFDRQAQQTQWLCEKLVAAGILEFEIRHSK